jgi:hypothetical protein
MNDQQNHVTVGFFMSGPQEITSKYFPPRSHEYTPDEYGRCRISGPRGEVTLFFDDRDQVTSLAAGLASLLADWPAGTDAS